MHFDLVPLAGKVLNELGITTSWGDSLNVILS